MLFRDNILGFIPNADWLSIGFNVTRPNDPIDGLFTDEKTDNLVAYWETIAAEYQIPVMAHFHSFDTEARKTFRIPINTHNVEKGLIKVKLNQSEQLRAYMRAGVQGEQAIYDYVMNDGLRLADQVITRTKIAKNEVLATGKMTINENDINLTVDYGVPEANLQYTLDFGAYAEKDIPTQLQDIVDAALDNGVILTGFVCSRRVLNKLRQNAALQKAINGTYGSGALLRVADLNGFLGEEYGLNQIITNDLTYNDDGDGVPGTNGVPTLTAHRYFPANKISFFAAQNGRIGAGLWGDPPEVDAVKFMNVEASTVSPYVYVSQWAEKDPAVLWTKASGLFMPVLYNPNGLYVADVISTDTASA